jgi:asparagine N-glycosylation enzyme membrane subunit Stt3
MEGMNMSNKSDNHNEEPNAMLGWLIAPLAILMALLADYGLNFGLVLEMNEMKPFAVIAIAAALGMAPRVMKQNDLINISAATLSLVTLIVTLVLSEGAAMYTDSNLLGLIFFIVMFGGYLLDSKGRHEWNTVLIFSIIGLWTAMTAAINYANTQTKFYTLEGTDYLRTMAWQEAIGFVFFNTLAIFVIFGLLAAVLLRGVLTPASDKGWFGYIKSVDSKWDRATMPLQIALAVWTATHIAVLYYFNGLGDLDILAISGDDAYHGYIGFWPAALTGVVALCCAWMCAERWFTRALFIGAMWILYIVSSLYESGHWSSTSLEGSWAVWIWFGITFFIGVVIYWFATHEEYGGWMNREAHEPSQARVFWSNHWAGILTFTAFLLGLAIRIQWNFVPSMNSAGLDSWDMTGGSDPWYMKRVVEYVVAENAHLIWDADRNYPVGGINPRPPLFTWSMAIGAMLLTNLGIGSGDAVWYAMLALPAIFGALTVFPIAGIARDNFGKGAGVIAAWLIAFMPTHVQKSTWAMADHDSFVLLFLSAAFMFYLRAINAGGDDRLSRTTNAYPSGIIKAMSEVLHLRRKASANAIAAGVCFGIVALGWKGFVYGPAIIFLAYVLQVAMNMLRRKDSTILSAINILMLGTIFLMVLPFYGHPQLDLILNSTGLLPVLFIAGFTLAIAWITTGFRDKPWLLILGSLVTGGIIFGAILYVLQMLEISSAWEVLTSGSGYFTKNKIFNTIAEANAPKRGQLFSAFGPIVFILAIVMGILAIWDGLFGKNQSRLVLGMWVIIAAYMAWSAGRFLFNAAPAMAVMGSWGIVILWKASGAGNMARAWRRMGIRTPGERISNARKAVWRAPQFSAIGMVLLMLASQHASYGIDAGMPYSSSHESEMDETIFNIAPDILRWNDFGFSLLDDTNYDGQTKWYLGSFGSPFNDQGWNMAFDWLADQDKEDPFSDRPAFVSWWDYGFQALESGQHPTVADNFQSGIPATGNMLLARNQDDVSAMFIWRLSEADLSYNDAKTGTRTHTQSFMNSLGDHLTDEQVSEFVTIQTNMDSDGVIERAFEVIQVNGDVVMAKGVPIEDGLISKDSPTLYKVYDNGIIVPCTSEEGDTETCSGDAFTDVIDANGAFNPKVRSSSETAENTTHYIFGDYWYTSDLIEEYDSVSTGIHRTNAGIALITQMLTSSLDSEDLHSLYADLSNNAVYSVQNYEGAPGEMITRDHEIRYLGVDTKLYPRGGLYSQYNGGSPTGIFSAPTTLSGQDLYTFMDEIYMTSRGQFNDEMTNEEFQEESRKDMLNQQAGAEFDPLNLVDIRYDHNAPFFETMLARAYVGYGASTLGFDTNEQPGQHFQRNYAAGTSNSMMTNAVPMPGAMMNHFVISNWYDADEEYNSFNEANTFVKILKYYPGSEVSGTVTMSDNAQPLPNVRLLIERDAFSGEGEVDEDSDTYWIPIGFTDSDENGEWSYIVPAGKIRVSAYAGEYNNVAAKDAFKTGEYANTLGNDLTANTNVDRETNLLTALLGNVANMSWMGESTENITGLEADRIEAFDGNFDIVVESSGVAGTVTWSGHESFEGQALDDVEFVLRNIWDMTGNYTVTTTSGSFTTEPNQSRVIPGTGEVIFSSEGIFDTQGNTGIVRGFTGNYTRLVLDGRSYTSNATFDGSGSIVATWIDYDAPDCVYETLENVTSVIIPTWNETVGDEIITNTHIACLTDEADTYLFEGIVNASGRMTADGQVTIVKYLEDETFEGTGVFEGIGTANGTGQFIGEGTFSGPMVAPGSFYKTGLMPGTYNMIAVMENGREILLPDPVEVSVGPSNGLDMKMPGSIFEDILYADYLTNGNPTPLPNATIELVDFEVVGDPAPVEITTDENGSFSYGPLATGIYQWRVDIDQDGWYEVEENFTVGIDSENISMAVSIPTKRDVVITLKSGDTGLDLSNRTLTFTNAESTDLNDYTVYAVSDENGTVHAEINMGQWIISDESDEDYVLWHEVEVTTDDLAFELEYAVSVWINGSIWAFDKFLVGPAEDQFASPSDIPEFDADGMPLLEGASNVGITARSGLIELDTISDFNGSYSLRLPEGMVFHITADSFCKDGDTCSAGMLITNATLVTDTDLFLVTTDVVQGTVWLRDSPLNGTGVPWGDGISGALNVEVIATDANGLEWRDEIDSEGAFLMHLTMGNWTFTVSNADMNVAPVVSEVNDNPEHVTLVADPANITLNFRIYLDTNLDGVWENGTAISPLFNITSINEYGLDLQVTEDMYNSTTGELTVELSVGNYVITMVEDDPRDENASEYRKKPTGLPSIEIGLAPPGEAIEIMFSPEYLVSGTILKESGFPMNDSTVWLRNDAGDDFHPLVTDENGTFAEYVPQGDWYVEVADYESDSNVSEIFRDVISINGATSGILWKTKTAMLVTMQLQEEFTGVNVTATRVTAVSLDGLGNVSLGPSDNTGMISELLMPGNWTLSMERIDNLEMWILDEGIHNSADGIVNGTWDAGLVLVDKSVKVGGKIFWDLDENNQTSSNEGIDGVNVTVTSANGLNESLMTDEEGVWSLFVPIRDNYTVVAMKEGFATVTYSDNNSSFYMVNDTHESRDFEMNAGMVSISGNITDIRGESDRLENATITLHPASGIIRESITIDTTSYQNDTLSWSGTVQPGDWIVVVEGSDSGVNGGGIVIGLLEASVQEGASIDLVMETGGRLLITSSWTTIDSTVYHAGDVAEGVDVEIDLGEGITWITQFDNNGELDFLLPVCEAMNCVELDSKFETIQHDMNLQMNYTSGISVTVMQDTAEDRVMEFTKKVNSNLLLEVISVTAGTADFSSEDLTALVAIEDSDNNGYNVITLKLGITYEGTEISDDFTASTGLGVSQDSVDWTIEYLNDTEEWNSVMNIEMGIGLDNNDTAQLLYREIDVRITLPLQNQTRTYVDGHAVNMRFASDGGISEASVRVSVPQQYNISLEGAPTDIGVADGGETIVTLVVTNFGNGDDAITVISSLEQDCIDEGWQVTPPISNLTVAADSDRSQSFTIHAGANSTELSCSIDFTADSAGEFDTQTDSTNAMISVAKLSIIKTQIEPFAADAIANTDGIIRIPIENEGFLTATDVIVVLESAQSGTDFAEQQVTITVPAEGVGYAEFAYSNMPPGNAHLKVMITVVDTPVSEEVPDYEFKIKFSNLAESEESPFLMVAIVALTILVLYGGFKTARRGSSGRF